MSVPDYEIYALKYAQRDGRRPDHFVGGDPHDVPMPMDYFVWLVRERGCLMASEMVSRPTGMTVRMGVAK